MNEKVKRSTQVMIYPERKVNNARITTISLNNKTIKTPCYIPKIRTSKELDIIIDEKKINDYFQGIFFDILNVSSLNREKTIFNPKQTRLIPMITYDFKTLKGILPVFIDPNTEYLYLINKQKRRQYKNLPSLPQKISDFLTKSTYANYAKIWQQLYNSGDTTTVINWNVREQNKYQPDAIVPFTPFIEGENSPLIDIAIDVNKKSAFTIADTFGLEPSFYFNLNYSALRNLEQLKKITDFLMDVDGEYENVKIIFIKIKYFPLNDTDVRRNLGTFAKSIQEAVEFNNKFAFLIDADAYAIPCISTGFDGFIEPLNGYINDYGGGSSSSKFRSYYDRKRMELVKANKIKNKPLKCGCPRCLKINEEYGGAFFNKIDPQLWSIWCKEHLFYSRCQEVKEVRDAINDNGIARIQDKFINSSKKDFIEILGYYTDGD
jgi:hypothetical protein